MAANQLAQLLAEYENADLAVPGEVFPAPERDLNSILSIAGARLNDKLEGGISGLLNAVMAPGAALQGEYDQRPIFEDGSVGQFDPRMIEDAASLSGLVSLGSAPIPRPSGSIGMGGNSPRGISSIEEQASGLGVRLDLSETPNGIVVSRIVVPEELRNSGLGSGIMQMITDYADNVGLPVALTPSSDFGGNVRRLTEFYKNQGFINNSGRNRDFSFRETMIRPPR